MNEYDEYDNEEDSYIGYTRFLLQQLKSNQHAEKNNSLSWHQTQHSLPCSYQTLNYSANKSWKPQTRHFASSPLSPEEIISKKSTVAVNSNCVSFSASSSQVSEDSLSNNDSSSSHPPTPVEECSAKKYRGREGKELPRRRIGLGKRLKHLLHFGKVTKYCIKSAAVKQIAEQLETNEENVSQKMASLRSYYCQLRSQYKSAKTKSGSGTADIKKPT